MLPEIFKLRFSQATGGRSLFANRFSRFDVAQCPAISFILALSIELTRRSGAQRDETERDEMAMVAAAAAAAAARQDRRRGEANARARREWRNGSC